MTLEKGDRRTLPTSLPQEAIDGAVAEIGFDIGRIYKLERSDVTGRLLVKDVNGEIVYQDGERFRIEKYENIPPGLFTFAGVVPGEDEYLPVFEIPDRSGTFYMVNREDIEDFIPI